MFALLPLDANDNGTNFALIGIIVWVIVVIAQANHPQNLYYQAVA